MVSIDLDDKRTGVFDSNYPNLYVMPELKRFDAEGYLDSEEVIAEYLTAAIEDDNPEVFLTAALDVKKARMKLQQTMANSRQNEP
jgi:DNA-binding phage protein